PKPDSTSSTSAASASSSSGPSVSMSRVLPLPAASIMTPMMLLALMRRPLRVIQTSAEKPVATWVMRAEVLAWIPSLLTTVTSALRIRRPVVVAQPRVLAQPRRDVLAFALGVEVGDHVAGHLHDRIARGGHQVVDQ